MEIKVGYIVAYDYELLKYSLPTVYLTAEKIVIAIDKDRKTFTGGTYAIDSSFFSWLKEVDTEKKITIYEDNFYIPGLTANEADTRERNMLSKKMGQGGWHFQVDVDEYFINFKAVIAELKKVEHNLKGKKITLQIYCTVIFKAIKEGFFVVDGSQENFAIATNHPQYTFHRYNDGNEKYVLNHLILHQSWGRNEEDLAKKLNNWSHSKDFDTESYFNFWKSVNSNNYKYIHNFHPLFPTHWKKLKFVRAVSIESLINQMPSQINIEKQESPFALRKWLPPFLYNRLAKFGIN